MLSTKAYNMLAKSLAPRIANGLQMSDRFCELMHELIPELITEEIGECDEDTLFELSLCVMDKMYIKTT